MPSDSSWRSRPEGAEKRCRISAEKTIAAARGRLGEKGYNLIHNNCEHFAYECAYGIKKSTQEEDIRKKWLARPVLDVYFASIPESVDYSGIFPPERYEQLLQTKNERLKKAHAFSWRMLEYALRRSLSLDINNISLYMTKFGKWESDSAYFSLSHTDSSAVVAVSNGKVGVDAEGADEFSAKYRIDERAPKAMLKKNLAPGEKADGTDDFLKLWTQKESIYKAYGKGAFVPSEISAAERPCVTVNTPGEPSLYLSVCGDKLPGLRFYRYSDGTARNIRIGT